MTKPPPPPALPAGGLPFTTTPAVADLNIPIRSFLSTHTQFVGAAIGALVYSRATGTDRVLLIQRAAHDSMPLQWEIPGGAADGKDDFTLMHAAVRELWEEAGLKAKRVLRQVSGIHPLITRRKNLVGKVTFEVEVEVEEGGEKKLPKVTLDPNEHARFLWATEEECAADQVKVLGVDGEEVVDAEVVKIRYTAKEQKMAILDGFKLRREDLLRDEAKEV
ncbi:NUDIX hydrolase domain-like protein [Chaetomium sp. MPI-SDFR-AT-0129]|nr:NUDIX hydrolase domain-like protein [Chaetomium sp. MPI-SDFR-AT-0129]